MYQNKNLYQETKVVVKKNNDNLSHDHPASNESACYKEVVVSEEDKNKNEFQKKTIL